MKNILAFLGTLMLLGGAFLFLNFDLSSEVYEVEKHLDITYYEGAEKDTEKHKLDLYLPKGLKEYPLILWIHGGAWASGDRKKEAGIAEKFAQKGIGFAAMSYRLSDGQWMNPSLTGTAKHPDHIDDCVYAFKWLHENASKYGNFQDKIFVSGFSAGAHLSALMSMDASYLKKVNLDPDQHIRGAIPVSGAYEMVAYYKVLVEAMGKETADAHVFGVFGDLKTAEIASPSKFLGKTKVPMFIASDNQTHDYTKLFEGMVADAGEEHISFYYDAERTHRDLYFDLLQNEKSELIQKMVDFVLATAQQ